MATLLNKQKPIAFSGSAWCPGGLIGQNAFLNFSVHIKSTALHTDPIALKADLILLGLNTVSASILKKPFVGTLFIIFLM
mgnify:CR=1 FL=1